MQIGVAKPVFTGCTAKSAFVDRPVLIEIYTAIEARQQASPSDIETNEYIRAYMYSELPSAGVVFALVMPAGAYAIICEYM